MVIPVSRARWTVRSQSATVTGPYVPVRAAVPIPIADESKPDEPRLRIFMITSPGNRGRRGSRSPGDLSVPDPVPTDPPLVQLIFLRGFAEVELAEERMHLLPSLVSQVRTLVHDKPPDELAAGSG